MPAGEPLAWEVRLPERGSARRRGAVAVRGSDGATQEREVPLSVARRLSAAPGRGPLPAGEIDALVERALESCARERVEALVGRRDYCEAELAERLRADGYPEEVVAGRARRAREAGVVDDGRYSSAFARSKALAGWGRARIERELVRRGVARDVASSAVDEVLAPEDERARALELASRRRLTGRNDAQRIARFLCGRGFSPGVALDVAREVVDAAR